MSTPHPVPRRIWILYRVRAGTAADPEAGASTTAGRRERLRAFSTPEGARSAAASDLDHRAGEPPPSGEGGSADRLQWERWGSRLVSESHDGVAYTVERYDVLEN